MKREKIETIIAYAIIAVIFIGLVYIFRVMPYDNDWSCLMAECRRIKQ